MPAKFLFNFFSFLVVVVVYLQNNTNIWKTFFFVLAEIFHIYFVWKILLWSNKFCKFNEGQGKGPKKDILMSNIKCIRLFWLEIEEFVTKNYKL